MQDAFGTENNKPVDASTLASQSGSMQEEEEPSENSFRLQVVEPDAPILVRRATSTVVVSREPADHRPRSPARPASNLAVLDAQAAAEQARQGIQQAKKKARRQPAPLGVGLGADDASSSMDADLLSQNQNSILSRNDSTGARGTANSSDFSLQDLKTRARSHPGAVARGASDRDSTRIKDSGPARKPRASNVESSNHHGAVVARRATDPDWARNKETRVRNASIAASADQSNTEISAVLSPDTNPNGSYSDTSMKGDPRQRVSVAAMRRAQEQQRGPISKAVHWVNFVQTKRQSNNGQTRALHGRRYRADITGNENHRTTLQDFETSPPVGAVAINPSLLESGGYVHVEDPNEGDEIIDAPVSAAFGPGTEMETMDPSPNVSGGLVTAVPVTDDFESLKQKTLVLEKTVKAKRDAAISAHPVTGEEADGDLGGSKQEEDLGQEENIPRFYRRLLYGISMVVIVVIAVVIGVVVSTSPPSTSDVPSPTLSPSIILQPTTSSPSVMPSLSMAPTPKAFKKFETKDELITAVDSYWETSGTNATLANIYGHPMGTWDVSQITDFSDVFSKDRNGNMESFTTNLSDWHVGNGQVFSNMFKGASLFQSDLSRWDTSKATDMMNMFSEAAAFTSDLSRWQTGKVTSMLFMFARATQFNSDLSRWDTSSVFSMTGMFWLATSFSSNLSAWDVGNVEDVSNMFTYATNFTSDLSGWKLGRVRSINDMFSGATNFSANLCLWGSQLVSVEGSNMFTGTACPNTTDPNFNTKTPFCYNCNGS